jgi:hypothetical protein
MIRPFALADILLVYRLQRSGAPLAIEHTLTHPRPPLSLALTAPWPWAGRGVATYVLRERGRGAQLTGFVQLLKRSARPEADLLHLSPAHASPLQEDLLTDIVWRRLLNHCCAEAAQHGLQRIFVSVPDGGPEMGSLRDAGFSLYTRETIYRLAEVPPTSPGPAGMRRQYSRDSWALQRLYAHSTPCLVQQAEGAMTGVAGFPPLSWWEPDRWRGLVWIPAGEVRGAVQVHVGRAGHWVRVWGASALTAREIRALVEQGLGLLLARPGRHRLASLPVYATVRDYEIGLSGALTSMGFVPFTDRARFVKHTVATRRMAAPAALPALEARQEVPIRSQAPVPIRSAPAKREVEVI